MLRENNKIIVRAHRTLDLSLSVLAFVAAYFVKKDFLPSPFKGLTAGPNYYIILLLIVIIWYLSFKYFDLYSSYRNRSYPQILWNLLKAVCSAHVLLSFCLYLFKITDVSRIMMGIFLLVNLILLGVSKGVVYRVLRHYRKKGYNFRNVLIVGASEGAKEVIDAIGNRMETGYRIIGCLTLRQQEVGKIVRNGLKVIGNIESIEKVLWREAVDELIFSVPLEEMKNPEKYIFLAEKIGVMVRILPQWHVRKFGIRPTIGSFHVQDFLGIPTLALVTTPQEQSKLLIKDALDYAFAAIAVILFSPVFLVAPFAIKLSSKGPVLFKQERVGMNGRRFTLYKFRTMYADAEKRRKDLEALNESDGPAFKIKNDPRIVPIVGTLLRKTSLDELPQLFNVLKGELSLVGPRPPLPAEVDKYDIWQRRRLSMKPGLTCTWQITPRRNEVSFENWMKMDLSYIDNWSLSLDLKILASTIRAVLLGAGR